MNRSIRRVVAGGAFAAVVLGSGLMVGCGNKQEGGGGSAATTPPPPGAQPTQTGKTLGYGMPGQAGGQGGGAAGGGQAPAGGATASPPGPTGGR